jgi:hypothetical protein
MYIGKSGLQEHQGTWGAHWYSSCPACAEAERIADEIDSRIPAPGALLSDNEAGYHDGLREAWNIATGADA